MTLTFVITNNTRDHFDCCVALVKKMKTLLFIILTGNNTALKGELVFLIYDAILRRYYVVYIIVITAMSVPTP